jgi:hypothetical protein
MIDYCTLECRLLASLMSNFREVCIEADIVPKEWSGPGWIAARLLEKHGIPKRPLTANEALLAVDASERLDEGQSAGNKGQSPNDFADAGVW